MMKVKTQMKRMLTMVFLGVKNSLILVSLDWLKTMLTQRVRAIPAMVKNAE